MPSIHADFLILGSGFGGSLLALILARSGRRVVLVDRSQHPRFAIGESTTPLADRTLAQLADRYSLPELRPLCHWGSWVRETPQLLRGRKRGFTYFDQTSSAPTTPINFDARRLLVSASVDDEHSDTHWLRSDVDQFLFNLAVAAGVQAFQGCTWQLRLAESEGEQWVLNANCQDHSIRILSPFVVDATGSPHAILQQLGVPGLAHELKTNSRSLYAHFSDVVSCEELLRRSGIAVDRFPYRCDDAAVHQVLSDGWMWQLRFDDQSVSAGFMIDQRAGHWHGLEGSQISASEEWAHRVQKVPFLAEQFASSRVIRPDSGIQRTGRIQRLANAAAGRNWAALTNTVGFIDPLHSTGIAHTLFSVARLAELLTESCSDRDRTVALANYSDVLIDEIRCVDELVEGCYQAIPSFRLWSLWGMLYFAAATSMEQNSGDSFGEVTFLCANDQAFRATLLEARHRLKAAAARDATGRELEETRFAEWLKTAIAPWNTVGLFDEQCDGLYSHTAAPANAW